MKRALTRRGLFKVGGAGAAAAAIGGAASGCGSDTYAPTLERRKSDVPNVLLIVSDSTRRDFVGAYNDKSLAKTPSIDALAKQALVFDYAVPMEMPTGLMRRALMTGMRGFPLRDWVLTKGLPNQPGWTDIHDDQPMLTNVLGNAGITTGYVTDNPFLVGPAYEKWRRTLAFPDPKFSQAAYRGFNKPLHYSPPRSEVERYMLPRLNDTGELGRMRNYVGWNDRYRSGESTYSAPRVMSDGMKLLERMKAHQPFFLGVDAFDPHEPFDPPKHYMERFGLQPKGIEKQGIIPIQPFLTPKSTVDNMRLDADSLEAVRELYAGELEMTDAWMGRLLNKLDDLGLADNTVVWYLSDHGVTLGEHGVIGKDERKPFTEIHRVPYMIRHPDGKRSGDRSDYHATTHDVARTILSLQGVPVPGKMTGEDLSVMFDGREPTARPYFVACYQDNYICGDGRWTYVVDSRYREQHLFDDDADPGEDHNVADQHRDIVDKLDAVLVDAAGGTLPVFGRRKDSLRGVIGG